MAEEKSKNVKLLLKMSVVLVSVCGFLFQTIEFLNLYWNYPTVIDIQVSVPPEIETPGITFCNSNGLKPQVVCKVGSYCAPASLMSFIGACSIIPFACKNNKLPTDFFGVGYHFFFSEFDLNTTVLELMKIPLKEYFKCKIVSNGNEFNCSMEDAVIASYYSDTNSPNFCFTINSLWANPNKTIQKIKKTDKIFIEFNIDIIYRGGNVSDDDVQEPRHNTIGNPVINLVLHSPYLTASPIANGYSFMGGKKYKIKVTKDEYHLLPPPYQTNCTDYFEAWKMRGNVAPLNQMMLIEECKLNASIRKLGCVPYTVDYPHNFTLCRYCPGCENQTSVGENCTDLLRYYNQPCESITYKMVVEEMIVYTKKVLKHPFFEKEEVMVLKDLGYNCTFDKIFTKRCQRIEIEIVFDNFDITNLTYNPKFESIELFSVIGGYMGMYLGVSIVAVYDFAETAVQKIHRLWTKRSETEKRNKRQNKKIFETSIQPLYVSKYPKVKQIISREI